MTRLILTESGAGYTRPDDPGEPTTGKPRVSITDNEANILSALAAGQWVAELGTGLGVSTRALAKYAEQVDTVDVDDWVAGNVWPELIAEHSNVVCWHDRDTIRSADLVFIDADHDAESVRDDIEWAKRLLRNGGGLIVCHDTRYAHVKRGLEMSSVDDWLYIDTEHGLSVAVID